MREDAREIADTGYERSLDHVLDAFSRIDALIRGSVALAREGAQGEDAFRGLYISDADVETLLAPSAEPASWCAWRSQALRDVLAAMDARTTARLAASSEGANFRLPWLRARFGLNDRDQDLLLLALAPELSQKFEQFFAYLHNDLTKKRLTVDLALDLLSCDFADKLALRDRLLGEAPLVRHGLVDLFEDPHAAKPAFLGHILRIDPRIAAYLLDGGSLDVALAPFAALFSPASNIAYGITYAERDAFVTRALSLLRREGALRVHLFGPDRALRLSWARALCRAADLPLIQLDVGALVAGDDAGCLFDRTVREAVLLGAALLVDDVDEFRARGMTRLATRALETLATAPTVSMLGGGDTRLGFGALGGDRVHVAVERPSARERELLWAGALSGAADDSALAEIPALASKFALDEERIAAAVEAARAQARWRDERGTIAARDIYAACREQAAANLGAMAQRIECRRNWSELVLPEETSLQLREICDRVRGRGTVLESWGFARKRSAARGLSLLFSGPSGVGKSMAAEVMAGALSLDLYRIDLSAVVNKYIGETEKNLAHVFAEAESANVILFFDEADALFGKRMEVQDARDRYANLETSYLLQRIESFSGVSILASNLRRNMDDAFTRRLSYIVQFAPPDAPQRLAIWRQSFPAEAPLDGALDIEGLARHFQITGANISNIAVSAGFLAAADQAPIRMAHVISAARRELLKLGRSATKSEFGPFADMLDADRPSNESAANADPIRAAMRTGSSAELRS